MAYYKPSKDTYEHTCYCSNCGKPNYLRIPKGTTITAYFTNIKRMCTNCGCVLGRLGDFLASLYNK